MRSTEQKGHAHGRVSTVGFLALILAGVLANALAAAKFKNNPDKAALDTAFQRKLTMVANPSTLKYEGIKGGAQPARQTLAITFEGEGGMDGENDPMVSATVDAPWIQISTSTDHAQTKFDVSVKTAEMEAGVQQAEIVVASSRAENTPLRIPVALMVKPGVVISAQRPRIIGETQPQPPSFSDIILYNRRSSTIEVLVYEANKRHCTASLPPGEKTACSLPSGRQYWVALPRDPSFQPRGVLLTEDYPVNIR